MPLIPKSSKVRFVLIILALLVVSLSLYFRARDVRAPIVADIPVVENREELKMMEDGVIFDESIVKATTTSESNSNMITASTTATSTVSTTVESFAL
jgi:hypothetical protein